MGLFGSKSKKLSAAKKLEGAVQFPGDKSISHRYAMLAAIASGESEIHFFSTSADCQSTLNCLKSLGVKIERKDNAVKIAGAGLDGLRAPSGTLDAGNSGSTIRMLSGILAGQPFRSVLGGDASLSRRPMKRVADPLTLMGARIKTADKGCPPVEIEGGNLHAIRYEMPVASAQVKSAILLAGSLPRAKRRWWRNSRRATTPKSPWSKWEPILAVTSEPSPYAAARTWKGKSSTFPGTSLPQRFSSWPG